MALCWVTAENKPLAKFQRNRSIQIRRSMKLEDLYHVRTDSNPSDVGTRPSKVTVDDVGPGSRWEEGDTWMKRDIDDVLQQRILKTSVDLRVKDDEDCDYRNGFIFDTVPEVLTRGHVIGEKRVGLLEERANYSEYLLHQPNLCFRRW